MYYNCDLQIEIENGQFEIGEKNWKFGWERLEILKKKNWKSEEKLKLGKIVSLEKCGNLEWFGNLEKFEIWKKMET